jgi:hypothetical protein
MRLRACVVHADARRDAFGRPKTMGNDGKKSSSTKSRKARSRSADAEIHAGLGTISMRVAVTVAVLSSCVYYAGWFSSTHGRIVQRETLAKRIDRRPLDVVGGSTWTAYEEWTLRLGARRRVWLSVAGEVYDVTRGSRFYVGNGTYAMCFTGRDASRAFATGDFTDEGCVDDVEGLSYDEWASIRRWADTMREKYVFIGRLAGSAFYDENGAPTELKERFDRGVAAVAEEKAKDRERRRMYPDCASKSAEDGYVVYWCNPTSDGSERYPRNETRSRVDGSTTSRCACFPDMSVGEGRLSFDGCQPTATQCELNRRPE